MEGITFIARSLGIHKNIILGLVLFGDEKKKEEIALGTKILVFSEKILASYGCI